MPINLFVEYRLRVDELKIIGYLLSRSNGHGKAAFFLGFGFQAAKWIALADALKSQASSNPVAYEVKSPHGTRYSVEGELDARWKASIPAAGLEAGDVGVVVYLYRDGEAYEVEFMTLDGATLTIQTLEA